MKCNIKQQESAECEKRGCDGCAYNEVHIEEVVTKDEAEEFLNFIKVANDVCKEKGVIYEFECPICKGVAKACKSTYNGHLHAQCKKCDMTIME